MAITKLVLNGVEYPIGNLITVEGPQLYNGRELSEYTWAQLKTKIKNADFADLRVGDYKTINLTGGEVVKMQIAGIDTYFKTTDQQLGHHIDFISVDCLKDAHKWNETNNNNGTAEEKNPYMASEIKKYLSETVYPTLPSDVRKVITNKRMLMEERYSAGGNINDSTGWAWKDLGQLWLPTEYEVFGSTVWGTKGWSAGQACQYPLFANGNQHRIKGQGNGAGRCRWWLCTAGSGSSTHCCRVNSSGNATDLAACNALGVPVCFRVVG